MEKEEEEEEEEEGIADGAGNIASSSFHASPQNTHAAASKAATAPHAGQHACSAIVHGLGAAGCGPSASNATSAPRGNGELRAATAQDNQIIRRL